MDRLTGKNNDYCFTVCGGERKHIREECNIYNVCFERQMYERLKHYEDLKEAGRLVELPCKIGDVAYGIRRNAGGNDMVHEGIISEMYYTKDMKLMIVVAYVCRGHLGGKVFLTREEAEAALKDGLREALDKEREAND